MSPRTFPLVMPPSSVTRAVVLLALCAVLGGARPVLLAQEKPDKPSADSAGIYFGAEANAKDVGLPIYPGARPHQEKDQEKPSAKFGIWGNAWAFKLAVVKMESHDSPQKVAAFYKKALAKYGTVLDCGAPAAPTAEENASKSSKQLTCDNDKPEAGNLTFKAGTKEKQHLVGIQPNGDGTLFQLVYVESPESDKRK